MDDLMNARVSDACNLGYRAEAMSVGVGSVDSCMPFGILCVNSSQSILALLSDLPKSYKAISIHGVLLVGSRSVLSVLHRVKTVAFPTARADRLSLIVGAVDDDYVVLHALRVLSALGFVKDNARYKIVPDEATMALLLPPKSEYVNVHDFCLQMYEIPSEYIDQHQDRL